MLEIETLARIESFDQVARAVQMLEQKIAIEIERAKSSIAAFKFFKMQTVGNIQASEGISVAFELFEFGAACKIERTQAVFLNVQGREGFKLFGFK